MTALLHSISCLLPSLCIYGILAYSIHKELRLSVCLTCLYNLKGLPLFFVYILQTKSLVIFQRSFQLEFIVLSLLSFFSLFIRAKKNKPTTSPCTQKMRSTKRLSREVSLQISSPPLKEWFPTVWNQNVTECQWSSENSSTPNPAKMSRRTRIDEFRECL